MFATGKVFQFFIALQAEGTIEIDDAVGVSGTVYLRIPEGGTGQVSVSIKGSLRQYDAKSVDGSMIPNEETVMVKAVVGTLLMVEPVVYNPEEEYLRHTKNPNDGTAFISILILWRSCPI